MMIKITTYPEMNKKIVSFLRVSDQNFALYAAQRIEELEALCEELAGALGGLLYYVYVGEIYTERFLKDCDLYQNTLNRAKEELENG